jgi:hypothetical protein
MDGKKWVGKVKEKDEALNQYDDAIAAGKGAAILKKGLQ